MRNNLLLIQYFPHAAHFGKPRAHDPIRDASTSILITRTLLVEKFLNFRRMLGATFGAHGDNRCLKVRSIESADRNNYH